MMLGQKERLCSFLFNENEKIYDLIDFGQILGLYSVVVHEFDNVCACSYLESKSKAMVFGFEKSQNICESTGFDKI